MYASLHASIHVYVSMCRCVNVYIYINTFGDICICTSVYRHILPFL